MLNDRDLVDPSTGITHRRGTISIPTNEKVYDCKYHHSNVFTLYFRSCIRKLLDDLTAYLIKNREDTIARLDDDIDNIYIKFHVINPPSARSSVPTPKKSANKGGIMNSKNKDVKCFLICNRYICF